MTTSIVERLISRLRDSREVYAGLMCCTEAADLIEQQAKEIAELKETLKDHGEIQNDLCAEIVGLKSLAKYMAEALEAVSRGDGWVAPRTCQKAADEALSAYRELIKE